MRILLATAVAIAPLMTASGAMAEVVISTARTTAIKTSNATGSAADNIRIASGGAINVGSGAAVTLDSNHSVDIDTGGAINMNNSADGSTGILVNGGNTGNVTLGGQLNVFDTVDANADLDTDNDGDADGPFATGSGRYGIRVVGATALNGDVTTERTGAIVVEGNDSVGVSIEAPLTGDLDILGPVAIAGNNSDAVRVTGDVGGDVRLAGVIAGRGENGRGAVVEGDVGGQILVHSDITATGYRYTTPPPTRPDGFEETESNDEDILLLDELDADDLLQGGAALTIAGDVQNGVLLANALTYDEGVEGDDDDDGVKNGDEDDDGDGTKNRDDGDRDGNDIPDDLQKAPSITSFGSAPAVVVGSETRAITLGAVGTGEDAYGFVNHGTLTGNGVYEGVSATAMQIGGAGQDVTIAAGVRNAGGINASATNADATGLRFGDGASAPTLVNSGIISAGATSVDAAASATAVLIEEGSTVTTLRNSGTLGASVGGTANAAAVRDLSGNLTTIENTKAITTQRFTAPDGTLPTGATTAIDVQANTSGVTINQFGVDDGGENSAADPDTDGDGVDDADEPSIAGDILLGSGADQVNIANGRVAGNIAFGAGADQLKVSGGAIVAGVLSDTDGNLAIDVASGTLDARQTTALDVTSLDVGSEGNLIVTLDPATNAAGGFTVSGAATLADGAGLGVRFNSLIQEAGRFKLIDAGTLNYGDIDTGSLQENSPYIYVVNVDDADVAVGDLFVNVRRRTSEEAGLIPVEDSLYDSFYGAISADNATAVRNAFLAQTDREGFINLYEQLLPDHSGGPLLSLASGVDAVTRALTGRNATAAPGETSAWVQEINFYADKDKTDTYGFRSEGFGVAGGIERGTGLGAVGLTAAFTSSDLEDPEAEAEEVLSASLLELGLYWRAQGQYWTTWARGAAGYASFESERRFVGEGLNLANQSDWNGFTLAAAAGASYERNFGRFNVRPEGYIEYFSLSEDGHVEEGGGDGFDLEIDDREGHMFSATAAINVGMGMGENNWLRPEVRVGWRQNISVDPGETIARFRSGGGDFTLAPDSIEGGGPIVGFRLNIGNELGQLSINADAEMIEDYIRYMLFLRASFRF